MQQVSSTEVRNLVGNMEYPASKQELVDEAKNLHIRGIIIRALEACPDKEYNSPADVINECRTRLQGR